MFTPARINTSGKWNQAIGLHLTMSLCYLFVNLKGHHHHALQNSNKLVFSSFKDTKSQN